MSLSGPATRSADWLPAGSSHSQSSRTNISASFFAQIGSSAPAPVPAIRSCPAPLPAADQSCWVASHRVTHAGLKSALPFGPNGPDAEPRAKVSRPAGDQPGCIDTVPDGCRTCLQLVDWPQIVIALPPSQISLFPPDTTASSRPPGAKAIHEPCTSMLATSVLGALDPSWMESSGRPSADRDADPWKSGQYSRPEPSGHQPASSNRPPVQDRTTAARPPEAGSVSRSPTQWKLLLPG